MNTLKIEQKQNKTKNISAKPIKTKLKRRTYFVVFRSKNNYAIKNYKTKKSLYLYEIQKQKQKNKKIVTRNKKLAKSHIWK